MTSGRFVYGSKRRAPQGGISKPWIDEPLETSRVTVAAVTRNGMPGLLPYVWNIGEKLRRAEVDAYLRRVRELAGFKQVTGYYDRPAGGRAEAEKAAAAAERDRTLSVDCPECGQPAGARCVSLSAGKPANIVHIARVKAWEIDTNSVQISAE